MTTFLALLVGCHPPAEDTGCDRKCETVPTTCDPIGAPADVDSAELTLLLALFDEGDGDWSGTLDCDDDSQRSVTIPWAAVPEEEVVVTERAVGPAGPDCPLGYAEVPVDVDGEFGIGHGFGTAFLGGDGAGVRLEVDTEVVGWPMTLRYAVADSTSGFATVGGTAVPPVCSGTLSR